MVSVVYVEKVMDWKICDRNGIYGWKTREVDIMGWIKILKWQWAGLAVRWIYSRSTSEIL